MFREILSIIYEASAHSFDETSAMLEECINSDTDFVGTLRQIGIIPESLEHDSTLVLKSAVIKARADSADVLAESQIHGYSLAADAKAFRLSRTAKNQKDFNKVLVSDMKRNFLQNFNSSLVSLLNYSREQAVDELIKSLGIREKITHIDTYIKGLQS